MVTVRVSVTKPDAVVLSVWLPDGALLSVKRPLLSVVVLAVELSTRTVAPAIGWPVSALVTIPVTVPGGPDGVGVAPGVPVVGTNVLSWSSSWSRFGCSETFLLPVDRPGLTVPSWNLQVW